jgi:hypothetical protein
VLSTTKTLKLTVAIIDNPWVISNSIYNSTSESYLQKLISYTARGHDYDTLYNTQSSSSKQVTILLPMYSKESLSKLDTITAWTLDIDFRISIICSSQLKPQIDDRLADGTNIKVTVIDRSTITTSTSSSTFALGTAGASIWLQMLDPNTIETDYVYVMDESTPLTQWTLNELPYLFNANQHNDYKDALIGTRALVLSPNGVMDNYCLPIASELPNDISQPADMLLGAYLLKTSWLPYIMTDLSLESLKLPLGHYLSLNLQHQLNIPTIVVPSALENQHTNINKHLCEQIIERWINDNEWRERVAKNRFPTVLQYRRLTQQGALAVAQGAKQVISLYPLICRFKNYPVHLVLMGSDINGETVQHALEETNCHGNVQVHDFTHMREHHEDADIGRLVSVVQPRIMIQIKPTDASGLPMYYALQTMAKMHQIIEIGLPEKEIVHALWIPDLSLEALTSKALLCIVIIHLILTLS